MSSLNGSWDMTFLHWCCRMKRQRVQLFLSSFQVRILSRHVPGMWHNLEVRTECRTQQLTQTGMTILSVLRAGMGLLSERSDIKSLLSAVSCSAGQRRNRKSMTHVFHQGLGLNWLLLSNRRMETHSLGHMREQHGIFSTEKKNLILLNVTTRVQK